MAEQQPARRHAPSEADWEYASAVLTQPEDFCELIFFQLSLTLPNPTQPNSSQTIPGYLE